MRAQGAMAVNGEDKGIVIENLPTKTMLYPMVPVLACVVLPEYFFIILSLVLVVSCFHSLCYFPHRSPSFAFIAAIAQVYCDYTDITIDFVASYALGRGGAVSPQPIAMPSFAISRLASAIASRMAFAAILQAVSDPAPPPVFFLETWIVHTFQRVERCCCVTVGMCCVTVGVLRVLYVFVFRCDCCADGVRTCSRKLRLAWPSALAIVLAYHRAA